MSRHLIAGVVVVAAALTTAPMTMAQDREARFTVGGGVGVSNPLHGDLDFIASSWDVSARGTPARHLTIEGFATEWRHDTESIQIGVPLQGPSGVIGSIGRLTQRTQYRTMAFGASLLPTFSTGRVTVAGGGGVDVMFFQRRFEQTLEDCVSATAVACGNFSNTHSSSSLGAHLLAGVDVRIAPRLLAFGQFRMLVPVQDPGSGHTEVLGGVRLIVR